MKLSLCGIQSFELFGNYRVNSILDIVILVTKSCSYMPPTVLSSDATYLSLLSIVFQSPQREHYITTTCT